MTVLQLRIFDGTIIKFCFTGRNIDLLRHDTAVPNFKADEAGVSYIKTDEAAFSCLNTSEASLPHI